MKEAFELHVVESQDSDQIPAIRFDELENDRPSAPTIAAELTVDGRSEVAPPRLVVLDDAVPTPFQKPREAQLGPDFPVAPGAFYPPLKRFMDIALVVLLSPIWISLYLVIAALIALVEGRPIHHMSLRVGENGRDFHALKFRSMRVDADGAFQELLQNDPALKLQFAQFVKLQRDPRITRIGGFLRRTSLDELPQLWNILFGDMSLVGPRPVTRFEVEEFYGDKAPLVLAARPGLTGLWQVSGRSLLLYDQRVALDMQYVQQRTVRGDLVILLKTIP
ncbi:MAG: sugar transferase, partial [Actinomycetota bacterium]|nr:sugar transferase [Actinomycetota bacterium]